MAAAASQSPSPAQSLSVSPHYDGMVVLHTSGEHKRDKGDWVLLAPHVIECVMKRAIAAHKVKDIKIATPLLHSRRGVKRPGEVVCQVGGYGFGLVVV